LHCLTTYHTPDSSPIARALLKFRAGLCFSPQNDKRKHHITLTVHNITVPHAAPTVLPSVAICFCHIGCSARTSAPRQVHVYATDPNSPTMDTSDSVGWFTVDMRDLAGQRQQERWVKLLGASPAEVLISSSLAVARDPREDSSAAEMQQQRRPVDSSSSTGGHRSNTHAPATQQARASTTAASTDLEDEEEGLEEEEGGGGVEATDYADGNSSSADSHSSSHSSRGRSSSSSGGTERTGLSATATATATATAAVAATSAAEAVSELDALPVGPGADGEDARTFSLAISVKGVAGLSSLTVSSSNVADEGGAGFWLSYSIFGVVVQTDRFERLAAPPSNGRPLLEPMLDSFRLRATLQGLCQFLGEAPPLQVSFPGECFSQEHAVSQGLGNGLDMGMGKISVRKYF